MKFECTTNKLRDAVMTTARFTDKRANLPILRTILISAEGKSVTLRATNLECGVEIVIPARVEEGGTLAVPGDIMTGFLSNLSQNENLTISSSRETLSIRSPQVKAELKTLSPEDFPSLPSVSGENNFKIRGTLFSKAIRSVAFCASVASIKQELQSVLVFGEASKLYTVATDSFRLAEKTTPVRGVSNIPHLLLPLKNAAELARVLDEADEDVDVYYNENQLSVRFNATYYTTRLIDGTFPNYRAIIPASFTTEALVLKEDLSQAFKLLSVFADKFAQVVISTTPKEKTLSLSARSAEVGENTTTLKTTASGDPITMTFNGRYLADGLQGIPGESVKLGFAGGGKPLTLSGASDQSFLYIVMPMNR